MGKEMNKIAFIMSVYKSDCPEKLRFAIESMLSQTIPCDILIYRDGEVSNDLSEVLNDYKSNKKIFLFKSNINKGLAFALNFLIDKSLQLGYEYLARMDSDDISRPERIEKQVKYMDENKDVGVLGTSCKEFGSSFSLPEKHLPRNHEDLLNFSITRCPFIHPTVLFRAKIFSEGIRYPCNTTLTEDMALWFVLLKSNVKFANLNDILLDYYLDEGTIRRRKGFSKAISEIKIRYNNMITLKRITPYNIIYIASRFVFHMMPSVLIKLAYKYTR